MAKQLLERVAVLAAAAASLSLAPVWLPAYSAPGPGTWTRIGTPSSGTAFLRQFGHEGHLTITGQASADVALVDVYCLRGSGSSVDATTVATSVPVVSGGFSTRVPVPSGVALPQCRLRALPDGVSTQSDYLSSYAGPVVAFDSWRYLPAQDTVQLRAGTGTGTMEATGIGACSAARLATVMPDESVPGGSDGCLYSLGESGPGATHGTVGVDGHDAFTTGAALGYGLTPTRLASASFHLRHGGVEWTEVMPLDRCANDVAFPPSHGTCPTLVSTGVEIHQVSTYLPSGHQVRIRTEFRSTDGKRHSLRLDYLNHVTGPAPGEVGFRFPGQHGLHPSAAGQTVTALGHGAGTLLVRSNRFSDEGDPAVATRAITWSRTPLRITFADDDATTFEMRFRLTVPRGGSARLGFTDSDSALTRQAARLGRRGEAGMMRSPRITSPTRGAVIAGRSTTVTGVVTAGANGLPVSVAVNGHRATLKRTSSSKARFSVTFEESLGKHTLRAVARDAGGNARSTAIRVRNG